MTSAPDRLTITTYQSTLISDHSTRAIHRIHACMSMDLKILALTSFRGVILLALLDRAAPTISSGG